MYMKEFSDWKPLNDVWKKHSEQIEKSSQSYFLKGKEDQVPFENLIWPDDLYIDEAELDDVELFLSKRIAEMIEVIRSVRGIPPDMLSSYLLRTLIAGMIWQKTREGRY